jgi:hypothetical protein
VVIRSTWDYTTRRDEFVAWARSVEQVTRLANRAGVIEWNTDKRYLRELEASGIPVVPTTWLEPGAAVELPTAGAHVIKPSVGAGSLDAERFDLAKSGRCGRRTLACRAPACLRPDGDGPAIHLER